MPRDRSITRFCRSRSEVPDRHALGRLRWLGKAEHDAVHVAEVGLLSARDGAIWAHAVQSGAIVVTKDEDFAARFVQAEAAPVIVWLRVGNTSNRALRAWIDARLPGILRLAAEGHRLIEVIEGLCGLGLGAAGSDSAKQSIVRERPRDRSACGVRNARRLFKHTEDL